MNGSLDPEATRRVVAARRGELKATLQAEKARQRRIISRLRSLRRLVRRSPATGQARQESTALQTTAADYLDQVEQSLAGTPEERGAIRAEVAEHLQGAVDAGELDDAIQNLGAPAQAAATFNRARTETPAPIRARFAAAALDNLPLLLVTAAIAVSSLLDVVDEEEGTVALLFPPFVVVEIGGACVAPLPFACELELGNPDNVLRAIGLPVTLTWSIVGLGVLEARSGVTPGKRRHGLRVMTHDGLRVSLRSAIGRRLVFLVGPLAWLDWLPTLWGEDRRITEILAGTRVHSIASSAEG